LLSRPGAIPDIATAVGRYHDGFRDIRAGERILPDTQRPAYEASIRELLTKILALADYDVETVVDGTAALARLQDGHPCDLVFVDLKMPGMDGLMLVRQIKRVRPDLPIIIVTGFSSEVSAIEAINIGVAGYLTKPFRVPQVLAAAAKALGVPTPA